MVRMACNSYEGSCWPGSYEMEVARDLPGALDTRHIYEMTSRSSGLRPVCDPDGLSALPPTGVSDEGARPSASSHGMQSGRQTVIRCQNWLMSPAFTIAHYRVTAKLGEGG